MGSIETKFEAYYSEITKQKETLAKRLESDKTLTVGEIVKAVIKEMVRHPQLEHEWIYNSRRKDSFIAWKINETYRSYLHTEKWYLLSYGDIINKSEYYTETRWLCYFAKEYNKIDPSPSTFLVDFVSRHGILLNFTK